MFAKIEITGSIHIVTGMHIGGSNSYSAIGAVDSPVIKDTKSGNPIIPGSSLKGKMRTLLAKVYNTSVSTNPDDDCSKLTDLFGSSKKGNMHTSRVLFADMVMSNWDELKQLGVRTKTEVKFENTINRATGASDNLRQIERVVRGAVFPLSIVYEVTDPEIAKEDLKILKTGFELLEADYLGGSGSRGYGKIKFKDLEVNVKFGEVENSLLEECRKIVSA